MLRTLRVVASGLLGGLLIGILGVIVFVAACVRDKQLEWTALTDERLLPYWAVVVAAAAANSELGALAGRRGNRRSAPVAVIPLLLLLYPLATFVECPSDSKSWGVVLLVVVIFGLFVWVAGRVGQELGAWQRPAEPKRCRCNDECQ
jgi:hypothetical protein